MDEQELMMETIMDRRTFLAQFLSTAAAMAISGKPSNLLASPGMEFPSSNIGVILNLPAGIEAGDMIYVAAYSKVGCEEVEMSAGWVKDLAKLSDNGNLIGTIWHKVMGSSDAPGDMILDLNDKPESCAVSIHLRNREGEPITVMNSAQASSQKFDGNDWDHFSVRPDSADSETGLMVEEFDIDEDRFTFANND